MTEKCFNCGYTESDAAADARALGLVEELQMGVYTCCQIAQWADEQWSAWLEAAHEDTQRLNDSFIPHESDHAEGEFFPVRRYHRRSNWYRNSEDLG